MRSNQIFMACGANVSYWLKVTLLPQLLYVYIQCCNFKPFHGRFPSKYPSIGALLCIANVAHGNIHVRIVIPNGRHYLITNYRLEFWPIRLLLVCCYSVAIVNGAVTMLTRQSGLSIVNTRKCAIVVFRCFALVYKMD